MGKPYRRAVRRGFQENLVIALLLVGGFVFAFGWLIGVVLLWLSGAWTIREKLVGTLVVPGGLAFALMAGLRTGLATGAAAGIAVAAVLAVAALASAVLLARRARAPRVYTPNAV
jgi:hypothetical protein